METIPIAKNSITPFHIPYALCFNQHDYGKFPTILVEILNDDGSTVNAPNITIIKKRSCDGFITELVVNETPSDTGLTSDNLILIVKR